MQTQCNYGIRIFIGFVTSDHLANRYPAFPFFNICADYRFACCVVRFCKDRVNSGLRPQMFQAVHPDQPLIIDSYYKLASILELAFDCVRMDAVL